MGIEDRVEGRKQKRSEVKRLMVYDNFRRKHTIGQAVVFEYSVNEGLHFIHLNFLRFSSNS